MQHHEKYLHLILCHVHQDRMGNLIAKAGNQELFLQFEEEQESFWSDCLPKTSDSIEDTICMVSSGWSQEVWAYDELFGEEHA